MLSHATAAYAVFLQNFHVPLDLFFWESWLLAVEEWFYLLFPLIVIGLVGLVAVRGDRAYLAACAIFILLPIAACCGCRVVVTLGTQAGDHSFGRTGHGHAGGMGRTPMV